MSEFVTPTEFSRRVRIPERTVRALCAGGELPGAYRVGSRWRIDFAEFRAGARAVPPARLRAVGLPRDLLARCAEAV